MFLRFNFPQLQAIQSFKGLQGLQGLDAGALRGIFNAPPVLETRGVLPFTAANSLF